MKERVILHSDLNGFYASVECFENPRLRNFPVAVCGDAELRHGIVLAKNEIAKKYKIKTGDVIWEAKQKCPDLITVSANFEKYLRYSAIVKDIYNDYSDQIESFGIDEAWIDITGQDGAQVAERLRTRIKAETGLTVSVGASWNKIFAKLGSDLKKPDAVTIISKDTYRDIVYPLPSDNLLYVGRATQKKLEKYSIRTIGEIASADVTFLKERLGKWGEYIWCFANGYDQSPVMKTGDESVIKSVGNSSTTIRDLKNLDDVLMIVTVLSESVAARLREQWFKGQVVSLYLRDQNLCDWNKQMKIERPTFISEEIIQAAMRLFKQYNFSAPIRNVGVRVMDLSSADTPMQIDLFASEAERVKKEKLEHTVDEIRYRFGHFMLNRGIEHVDKTLTRFCPRTENVIHPYSYFR